MLRQLTLALVLSALTVVEGAAQSTVFVVRHAERADAGTPAASVMGADPDLSAAGLARAESLAVALKDAHITAIYATEFKRTQQTAAPLAKALGLTVTIVAQRDLPVLMEKVKATPGNVLVVGHSNTAGEIVNSLGIQAPIKIADTEFDNLFIVVQGAKPAFVWLHYR